MYWLFRTSPSGRLCLAFRIWGALVLLSAVPASGRVEPWTFGGQGEAWQQPEAVLVALETTPQRQLRPQFTRPDQNLSVTAAQRGGGIDTPIPTLKSTSLEGNELANMIDGDPTVAFRDGVDPVHADAVVEPPRRRRRSLLRR